MAPAYFDYLAGSQLGALAHLRFGRARDATPAELNQYRAVGMTALADLRMTSATTFSGPGIDYDTDDDNLIEINTLDQLNAIRWGLDGNGVPASTDATSYFAVFPLPVAGMGCRTTCLGYELVQTLDFNDDASYADTGHKAAWTTGSGWAPIGSGQRVLTDGSHYIRASFQAVFEGNNHTIRNLYLNRHYTSDASVELFGSVIGGAGTIRNLVLVGGSITATSTSGYLRGGGLVGYSSGPISASYATGAVSADTSRSDTAHAGGLVGVVGTDSRVSASYWDTETSGQAMSADGAGQTTGALQTPGGYTGLYADWNLDVAGDGTTDDPWHFGTACEYPALQIDCNGDGTATWQEFGAQRAIACGPTVTPTATPTVPTATPTTTPTAT